MILASVQEDDPRMYQQHGMSQGRESHQPAAPGSREWVSSNGLTQIDISDPSHTMQTPGLDH